MADRAGGCRIYPEQLEDCVRNNPRNRAEVLMYDELKAQLGPAWTVFYHVAWLGPVHTQTPQDGETDFVLAHPTKGILLIEVKGGRIRFDAGKQQWYSKDCSGKEHNINPIEQVLKSKKAFLNKLSSLRLLSGKWIRIGHCVAFPEVDVPSQTPPSCPKHILIGADDLTYLAEKINSIADYFAGDKKDYAHGGTVVDELKNMLGRSYIFGRKLVHDLQRHEKEMLKLTEDQFRTLDMLNRARRVAVGGCAGSGKTLLAVEKAKRLAHEGARTLLTCYNRQLAEYLRKVAPVEPKLMIDTFHGFCRSTASTVGRSLPPFTSGSNDGLDELYVETFCDIMREFPDLRLDAVIIDEAQDFAFEWWLAIDEAIPKQGGILYVFYDDNQALYKGRGGMPADLHQIFLPENIRNSQQIFDVVQKYYRNEENTPMRCRGPIGPDVVKTVYSSEQDMQRELRKTLDRLINEDRIAAEDIVVLTPRALDKSPLMSNQTGFPYKFAKYGSARKGEIQCSTINSFKGLERKIIVVTELDDAFTARPGASIQKLCYTGFSRATSHLVVLGNEKVLNDVLGS